MLAAVLLALAPVTISSKDDLLAFDYRWSAEAAAIPALNRRFRAEAARQKRAALRTARDNAEVRRRFNSAVPGGDFFSRSWQTAGQTTRLLSLEAETAAHTGGAHPNSGTSSLLWDRRLAREISLDALLQRPGWWSSAIRQPFCTLLDRERVKRREEPVPRGEWPSRCPKLKELTLTLEDRDGDQRFDHVRATADPYVAGPYAEGNYVISLPITGRMIARLKPQYKSSFEPQPPVQ